MKVTISDVAKLAGVSTATVSHTINNTRYVSNETKEKVYRAIEELGYTPDASARSFRTGKKKIIGFIVPDIANKFFATMIESVEKYLSANGYQLIIANTRENMDREETNIRLLTAGLVDGLLVAAPERDDGRRIVIDGTSPILSCTLREDHYGVLTEVLVIDKTRNVSYSVQNRDMLDRGGQCRRVVYTPGQSTWAAMRYTGEYQIRRSREEELTIELGLAGCFPAFPGDTVRLELEAMGLSGEYRVAEAENTASPETGEVCTLILRERI